MGPLSNCGSGHGARTSAYQRNLIPNCVWSGEFPWQVMMPNELEVTLVFGPPDLGLLNARSETPPKLDSHALHWLEVFEHGQVEIANAVVADVGNPWRQIAKREGGRLAEDDLVEVCV